MDFKVNEFTTIKDFKRKGIFKTFMKWGEPFEYEEFTGIVNNTNIKGYICLADNNIYGLTYL